MASWQEAVFTAGALVFAISLLPTVMAKEVTIPRKTSIPTTIALWAYCIAFLTLGMTFSAAATGVTAGMWTFIMIRRAV